MTAEFEGHLTRREALLSRPRPATFGLIEAVSKRVPGVDDRSYLFELAIASAASCSDLDSALTQRLGPSVVLALKGATAALVDDPEIVEKFPEPVRKNALRWASRGVDELRVRAQEEIREERRAEAPFNRESHLVSQHHWSKPREKSGLPRGMGRYSEDDRPKRAKRHNGRGIASRVS